VERGYCEVHRRFAEEMQEDHHQEWQHLYNSVRWQKIRRRQLMREPFCAECLKNGIFTIATDVDHVQPHRGDIILFYRGPFQSLCHSCHAKKTALEVNQNKGGRGG
jgi:5-methylcytosine-specific restriction protein A